MIQQQQQQEMSLHKLKDKFFKRRGKHITIISKLIIIKKTKTNQFRNYSCTSINEQIQKIQRKKKYKTFKFKNHQSEIKENRTKKGLTKHIGS